MDHGGAPHFVVLRDQIDDGPVREPGQNQFDQSVQRLVDVEGGRQARRGLGQQGQSFQFTQRFRGPFRMRPGSGRLWSRMEEHQRADVSAVHSVRSDEPGDGQDGAVRVSEVVVVALRRVPGVERLPHGALTDMQRLALGPAVQQFVGILPDKLFGPAAQHPLGKTVDRDDATLLVDEVRTGP